MECRSEALRRAPLHSRVSRETTLGEGEPMEMVNMLEGTSGTLLKIMADHDFRHLQDLLLAVLKVRIEASSISAM